MCSESIINETKYFLILFNNILLNLSKEINSEEKKNLEYCIKKIKIETKKILQKNKLFFKIMEIIIDNYRNLICYISLKTIKNDENNYLNKPYNNILIDSKFGYSKKRVDKIKVNEWYKQNLTKEQQQLKG